mgnify:CR=1 FL=1
MTHNRAYGFKKTKDIRDGGWRDCVFAPYDTVYHVAGIAHADVGNVSDEIKEMYYKVNTDLAIETAKKAKDAVSDNSPCFPVRKSWEVLGQQP